MAGQELPRPTSPQEKALIALPAPGRSVRQQRLHRSRRHVCRARGGRRRDVRRPVGGSPARSPAVLGDQVGPARGRRTPARPCTARVSAGQRCTRTSSGQPLAARCCGPRTSCRFRSRLTSTFQSSAGAACSSASASSRSARSHAELVSSLAAAVSTAPRARYRSAMSSASSCGTKTPRAGWASSRPSWIRRWKASRTGPRLTPSWRAISTSRSAWPAASLPLTIPERSCAAIRSGVESRRSGSSTSPMLPTVPTTPAI